MSDVKKGYVIAEVEVSDQEQFKKYAAASGPITAKFGGNYIVRGGKMDGLENSEAGKRLVVIEFESFEQANAWYNSPEYTEARKLRENAAVGKFMVVEGN